MTDNPLEGIDLPDDAGRPIAPELSDLSPRQKLPGRQLKMIHNHFRQNMQVLQTLMAQAESGELDAQDLVQGTEDLSFIQNYRQFGTICGQYCQIINNHHSIEDHHVFPALSAKAKAFQKVVQRLIDEHEVVHELLERLIVKLNELIENPSARTFKDARIIYAALEALLLSHFRYEEDSIGDAIGYFDVGV